MRRCGVRGNAVCVTGVRVARMHLGGVGVAGVTACAMCAAGVRMPVSTVPMAGVSDVGDTADRHRGEASGTQREGKPIDVHTPNTTSRAVAW